MHSCNIIGISDSHNQWFSPEVKRIITKGRIFSGGKRHHEIVRDMLPEGSLWIDITVPLSGVFEQYKVHDEIVVFASGDPLFFGFANTMQRECPEVEIHVFPSFNSLQMLAHRLVMPYHDMHVVSLTGRPWDRFDEALIHGEQLIGCLTDKRNTPHAIWHRMQDYGYDNYIMYVGENLGNEETERISRYEDGAEYSLPNCVILQRTRPMPRRMGIADHEFHLLNGRAKMITKMPIRLCTIACLDLTGRASLWDVGFCTGSVSIEAKLQHPHLHVTSFEVREEGRELMDINSRRFHAPGITAVIGDFLCQDLSAYPAPDAVFIGGHGGRMREIMEKIKGVLLPGGVIVFNSVSENSSTAFLTAAAELGMTVTKCCTMTIDDNNPITIYKAQ